MRTVRGEPLALGEREFTPIARSVSFSLGRPGGPFAVGYACNRPVAVLETRQGHTRRIGIPNIRRRLVLGALASGLLFALVAVYLGRPRRQAIDDQVP